MKPIHCIRYAFLVMILICIDISFAEENTFVWRKVVNNAFTVNEYLRYTLSWGIIHGGYSTMAITEIVPINGRMAYHLVSKTRSNAFFDAFFKVRDINQSWLDVESLCSHRFSKNIQEGRHRRQEEIEYNHINETVRIHKKDTVIEGEITAFIQDVFSSLYYVRAHKLRENSEFDITVNTSGKNWPLIVKVYKKEKITIKLGRFNCYVVEPVLADEGIFETKGRILIWITDDEKHLPVKMNTKIKIGSVTAELISTTWQKTDNDF